MPGFKYEEPKTGDPVKQWLYGKENTVVKCGAPPGSDLDGCIRDALAIALRVYSPQDEAVHAEIKRWKGWVDWPRLPGQVASLNKVSAFGNVHNLLSLKDKGVLKLPMTRLGRAKLFAAGFRSLLLRPMAKSDGWSQHCIPLTASPAGEWSVHDPNEVVLLDAIPDVASLEGAYILRVRPKGGNHGPRYSAKGPPPKKVKRAGSTIPAVPSDKAAVDYLICTMVDRSFQAFAFESGLERSSMLRSPAAIGELAGGMCEHFMVAGGSGQKLSPVSLWKEVANAHLSVKLEFLAYDPGKITASPAEEGYFLVGCESKQVRPTVDALFLVRLASFQVSYFCPVRLEFLKHANAKSALGLRKPKWAKQITWG